MKRFLCLLTASAIFCTASWSQEELTLLSNIQTLDFVKEVHELSPFMFECKATFRDIDGMSIGSIISDANETLVSDGNGCVQITSYTQTTPSRLVITVNRVPEGKLWRRVIIETGDGKQHSIIQGTDELQPVPDSYSKIFPNPAFGKTFTVSDCAPGLEYEMAIDNKIISGSTQIGGGYEDLVFGPFWQKGDYSVYNSHLGFSRYSSYLSWYDIFDECFEPINTIPEEVIIPPEGGVFEYTILTYRDIDESEYPYIAKLMNTVGIPDRWTPNDRIEIRMTARNNPNGISTIKLQFLCTPNFSIRTRQQNTMFCLAEGGRTVRLTQAGNPSGELKRFNLIGEWINDKEFTLLLSGSQPGVTYTLLCNGTEVLSTIGTGKPIDWSTTSAQGTYTVLASYDSKTMYMNGILEMKQSDYVFGDNYIATKTMLSENDKISVSNITYYGGLGYPVQIQQGGASGDGHALITPIVYDSLRRSDAESYKPYPSPRNTLEYTPESLMEDFEYYSETYGEEGDWPYIKRTFESYRNGRLLSVRKPGFSFWDMDKKIRFEYRLNSTADSVRRLEYTYASQSHGDSIKCYGNYSASTLSCTRTVNEDADTSFVFVDPFGRTVLSRQLCSGKRYDTYYVYDLKDSLVCAIQPEGSLAMPDAFPLDGEFAGRWCFTYRYDAFGNIIESHAPGGGHIWTFYDLRNLPVFCTDDRMMKDGEYRLIQYDMMDRITMECYCTIQKTHDEIRSLLEAGVNPFRILSFVSAPLREASYYFIYNRTDTSGFRPCPYTGNASSLDTEHCMTMIRRETLYLEPEASANDTPGSFEDWHVKRDWFYDSFGRTIQIAETYNDGSKSTYSYKYDFVGNVLVSSERHETPDGKAADELVMEYTYDNAGRKTSCSRMLNGKSYPMIEYGYDALGRLKSVSVAERITETYAYDLQGAMSRLENTSLGEMAFLQVLKYNDPSLDVSVPSYSGRISEIGYADAMQDYQYMSYYYDHAGRLADTQRTGDDREPYGAYEERDIKYDANGNLLAMKRIMSWGDSTRLSFGYSGNRMERVSEQDSLWMYGYDASGNMAADGHRGLELSYNFLNLPSRIRIKDSGSLVYSYLSDGTMLSVTDSLSGRGLKFRGSFIYTVSPEGEESVESVSYGEGRLYASTQAPSADNAVPGSIDASPDFIDTWSVRDYLGSVRMVVDISSPEVQSLSDVILRRSDYLPFGLPFSPAAYSSASSMPGNDVTEVSQGTSSRMSCIPQSSLERWQYNGKPEQVSGLANTGLLDYGARFYDPYVARWTAVDPMADKRHSYGCYVFCSDDPVNRVDQDGDVDWRLVGTGAFATVSGVGSVAGGAGMVATGAGAPAGMFFMVEGLTSVGLGVTLMITGAVTDPSESTDKLLENMPTSATEVVSKAADVVAGNENGEIETATSVVMLGIGMKGAVKILFKSPDQITVLDKLSLAVTSSDLATFILNWLTQDEDEVEDEDDIKDSYGLN